MTAINPNVALELMHGNPRHIAKHIGQKPHQLLDQLFEKPDEPMTKSSVDDSRWLGLAIISAYEDRLRIGYEVDDYHDAIRTEQFHKTIGYAITRNANGHITAYPCDAVRSAFAMDYGISPFEECQFRIKSAYPIGGPNLGKAPVNLTRAMQQTEVYGNAYNMGRTMLRHMVEDVTDEEYIPVHTPYGTDTMKLFIVDLPDKPDAKHEGIMITPQQVYIAGYDTISGASSRPRISQRKTGRVREFADLIDEQDKARGIISLEDDTVWQRFRNLYPNHARLVAETMSYSPDKMGLRYDDRFEEILTEEQARHEARAKAAESLKSRTASATAQPSTHLETPVD